MTARSGGLRGFLDLPPVWMVGAAGVSWVLTRVFPVVRFDLKTPGLLIAALGVGVIAWSVWWFWRKRTPIEPRRLPQALIVEGPYRINRNPIYMGMGLCLMGHALWLGALSAFLPVAAFLILIDRRFVRGEEEALRQAFGARAETYLAKTRRW